MKKEAELRMNTTQLMIDLFDFTYLKPLSRTNYLRDIETIQLKFHSLLTELEHKLDESTDEFELLSHMIPDTIKVRHDDLRSNRKKESYLIDCNLNMVGFVLPVLGSVKATNTERFVEAIVTRWNTVFPTTKIKASSIEVIQSGFRTRLCYISTAICSHIGKSDDCYELQLLRNYRDTVLLSNAEGRLLVEEYYDVAPTIVNRINKRIDAQHIYQRLWERYLYPCIHSIEQKQYDTSQKYYASMVQYLYETVGRGV